MHIVVCLKQVVDALIPPTDLHLDLDRKKVLGPPNTPPVTNGYDEQALEAALLLKDSLPGVRITALSAGDRFSLEVMKRALAAGADDLVLVQDPSLDTWDASYLARVLAAAVTRLAPVDLVLCGRQASDWDNALVPPAMAEILGWTCLTVARQVEVAGSEVRVDRVLADGFQAMAGDLPAVVTLTSELGALRFPTVRGRLEAARRQPRVLTRKDLDVPAAPRRVDVLDLSLALGGRNCQYVTGHDGADAGRRLAGALAATGLTSPEPTGGSLRWTES